MRWIAAALLCLLAGCAARVDAEQARICRMALPALNAEGAELKVLRTAPGPGARTIRIDYAVQRVDRLPLDRHVICTFASEGLGAGKADLTGLATERGPITGASLYLLRRYYLETPDGLRGAPGDSGVGEPALEVPMTAAVILQHAVAALPRIAIYALLAAAYALVFGLVGRINLAFGELAAVGAAGTVAGTAMGLVMGATGPIVGLGLGLAMALWAGALHGWAGGIATLGWIPPRHQQASLIATVGLSLALMEYLRLAQSPVAVWLPPFSPAAYPLARAGDFVVSVSPVSLATAGLGAAAAALLLALIRATRFGRAWRAAADDGGAAALCGVDVRGLLLRTLALSGALAALAGFLIVVQYGGLGFAGGFQFGLKALIAAVLGGIGSVPGALLGGVAIGLFETAWSVALPIDARDIALYCTLVAALIFRPGGFLGWSEPTPRQV